MARIDFVINFMIGCFWKITKNSWLVENGLLLNLLSIGQLSQWACLPLLQNWAFFAAESLQQRDSTPFFKTVWPALTVVNEWQQNTDWNECDSKKSALINVSLVESLMYSLPLLPSICHWLIYRMRAMESYTCRPMVFCVTNWQHNLLTITSQVIFIVVYMYNITCANIALFLLWSYKLGYLLLLNQWQIGQLLSAVIICIMFRWPIWKH